MFDFYKLTNTFLCINLSNKVADAVNKEDHRGLQTIHVFVFDPDKVKIRSLATFGGMARRRRKSLIVHCANKYILAEMRKKLKGAHKDKYFHLSLMKPDGMRLEKNPDFSIHISPLGMITETDKAHDEKRISIFQVKEKPNGPARRSK